MDRCRKTKSLLIGGIIAAASISAALAANTIALRAARWLPTDRQSHALAFEPNECLRSSDDEKTKREVAIGRAAFRAPLMLGGQAARAGLSCNSCHRNGRGNVDFLFPGLSSTPGMVDVSSSLMSSHRGDGITNPTSIPDLGGPINLFKVSRDSNSPALENFIHALITEEFDGPQPSKLTLDSLATYLRMLSPNACPAKAERKIQLANYIADARSAMQAAQYSLDAKDPATARLMIASTRSLLGSIHERYAAPALANNRLLLKETDLELAAIEHAIDLKQDDVSLRITAWIAKIPRWSKPLLLDEKLSLFNAENF